MHLYIVHVLFDNLLPLEICRLFLLTWCFFLSCSGVAKVKRTQEFTHDLFAVSSSSGYVIASTMKTISHGASIPQYSKNHEIKKKISTSLSTSLVQWWELSHWVTRLWVRSSLSADFAGGEGLPQFFPSPDPTHVGASGTGSALFFTSLSTNFWAFVSNIERVCMLVTLWGCDLVHIWLVWVLFNY